MLDAVSICKRYEESMTTGMLVRFEELLIEKFGATPARAIPAEEAQIIYETVLKECANDA